MGMAVMKEADTHQSLHTGPHEEAPEAPGGRRQEAEGERGTEGGAFLVFFWGRKE